MRAESTGGYTRIRSGAAPDSCPRPTKPTAPEPGPGIGTTEYRLSAHSTPDTLLIGGNLFTSVHLAVHLCSAPSHGATCPGTPRLRRRAPTSAVFDRPRSPPRLAARAIDAIDGTETEAAQLVGAATSVQIGDGRRWATCDRRCPAMGDLGQACDTPRPTPERC